MHMFYHTVVVHIKPFQVFYRNFGALNFHTTLTKERNVYVVISGNFTPAQRHIVKKCCMIHVSQFKDVYDWLRDNNPNYANFKGVHFL
jgi:hypothetical protein